MPFVAFDPTCFGVAESILVRAVGGVSLEEEGHAEHVAMNCLVAKFTTSFTWALVFWLAMRDRAGRWVWCSAPWLRRRGTARGMDVITLKVVRTRVDIR